MSGGRGARGGGGKEPRGRSRSDGAARRLYYRDARDRTRSARMPDDVTPIGSTATTAVRVKGLDHVVLRVADMDRAMAFYEQVLGLHVERRLESIGLVQLRAGAAMIDLVPRTEEEEDGPQRDDFAGLIDTMR